jgi:hypothetical protein
MELKISQSWRCLYRMSNSSLAVMFVPSFVNLANVWVISRVSWLGSHFVFFDVFHFSTELNVETWITFQFMVSSYISWRLLLLTKFDLINMVSVRSPSQKAHFDIQQSKLRYANLWQKLFETWRSETLHIY